MRRKVIVFLFFLFTFQLSFSQNQTNFWYFGQNVGLDFSSGSPVALTNGATFTTEGTAVISDSSGNLLFYTDGITVWNKNNVQMPNGFGLLGDISTTQTIIVPDPGHPLLYYIFTLDDEHGPDGLNYSVVDMSLQSGDGDVTVKNIFLHGNMTEKVAAINHCNNHDIWVMTHESNSDAFLNYLVTDSGISAPVVTHSGIIHTNIHGQMKFSTDGKKLACAVGSDDAAELFDFNTSTGIVSSPLTIPLFNHVYGAEFSPDNSKLYISYYEVGGNSNVVQFDLNASNILSSQITVAVSTDPIVSIGALQLGRDNKIYVTKEVSPFVGVINFPNVAGTGCSFTDNAINLDPLGMGPFCMLGLPNFMQSYFHPSFPNIPCVNINAAFSISDTSICKGQCINFTDLSTGTVTSHTWTFSGATPSSSTDVDPSNICYQSTGTFNVRLIVSDGSVTDTIVRSVVVQPLPSVDAGTDATIPPGASVTLHATGNANSFLWTPSTGLSATNVREPVASPSETTTYTVTGTSVNGCSFQDEVTVFVELPCGEIFIPTAFSPNGDGENDIECVLGNCIVNMHFAIYDRWGEKVFETTDQKVCWDGKYKGELMNTASFVYYFKATLVSGEEISMKGNISLIR